MRLKASLLSLCAAAGAGPVALTPSTSVAPALDLDAPLSDASAECTPEAHAYASAAALARDLEQDAGAFDDALDDPRQQLVDCPESPPAGRAAAKLRRR